MDYAKWVHDHLSVSITMLMSRLPNTIPTHNQWTGHKLAPHERLEEFQRIDPKLLESIMTELPGLDVKHLIHLLARRHEAVMQHVVNISRDTLLTDARHKYTIGASYRQPLDHMHVVACRGERSPSRPLRWTQSYAAPSPLPEDHKNPREFLALEPLPETGHNFGDMTPRNPPPIPDIVTSAKDAISMFGAMARKHNDPM
eukprot:gene29651-36943_t